MGDMAPLYTPVAFTPKEVPSQLCLLPVYSPEGCGPTPQLNPDVRERLASADIDDLEVKVHGNANLIFDDLGPNSLSGNNCAGKPG